MTARSALLFRVAIGAALSLTSGCTGGGSLAAAGDGRSAASAAPARIVISIPHPSGTTGGARRPAYLSAATQSAKIDVTPQGSATSVAGFPQIAGLTPTSSGCTSTLASTQCVLAFSLNPGSYAVSLMTYDGANGTGNTLSAAQSIPETVRAGVANTFAMTLGGVPVSVEIFTTSSLLSGDMHGGFVLTPGATATAAIFGVDADGNIILGAGAPGVAATSSVPGNISVTAPTGAAPNQILLNSVASIAASITLTATITPSAQSGASAVVGTAGVAQLSGRNYGAVFLLGNGTIDEFDVNGNIQSPPGGFPGLGPASGIAYDPVNKEIYTCNANGVVAAFDAYGNQKLLTGALNVTAPNGMTYDSANGWFYLVAYNGTSTAVDGAGVQHTLTGGFPGLTSPQGVTFDSANGMLYAINAGPNKVLAFDANGATHAVPGTFAAFVNPTSITYDSANGFLYVLDANSVLAFDENGNAQTLSGAFAGLSNPSGIGYDPATGFLYVTNSSAPIAVYDANGIFQTTTGTFTGSSGRKMTFAQ
jgi:hypothetical protein